jgi:hypothetical protein
MRDDGRTESRNNGRNLWRVMSVYVVESASCCGATALSCVGPTAVSSGPIVLWQENNLKPQHRPTVFACSVNPFATFERRLIIPIMRPFDDKRATKIQTDKVPLVQGPLHKDDLAASPATEPKLKPGPLQPGPRPIKRAATSSPSEPSGKVIRGSPRNLALQGAGRLENSIGSDGFVRDESPWDTFKLYYECDLAGNVAVCIRSSDSRAARAIRQYPGEDADRILGILRSISHRNVVSVWECFRTSDSLYTLSKFDPITLDHIVACKAFPNQLELAAIISQVCSLIQSRKRTRSLIMYSFLTDYRIYLPKISITYLWIVPAF